MRLGLVGRGPVGRYLATRLDPECWTGRELGLVDHLDAVILAVPDDAIAATAARVLDRFAPKALIHCSGATPIWSGRSRSGCGLASNATVSRR